MLLEMQLVLLILLSIGSGRASICTIRNSFGAASVVVGLLDPTVENNLSLNSIELNQCR